MRKLVGMLAVMAFLASAAHASDLNMSVKAVATETNAVTVGPGAPVDFYIEGVLSDDVNEGLALVGFNLHLAGATLAADTVDIPAGDISCDNPMPNFVKNEGITNPAGFGGTLLGGDLVQVGGAQNTIKNTSDNAPFPVGTVLTGVAQPGVCGTAVIATGMVTAPMAPGDYQLQLAELFANVIVEGETIENVFLATEAAGVGTVENLTITVGICTAHLLSAKPLCDASLPRVKNNVIKVTFDSPITLPPGPPVEIRALLAGGGFGPDLAAGFVYSVEGGNVLRIRENGQVFANRTWYAVVNSPEWTEACPFKVDLVTVRGDASGNKSTDVLDANGILANRGAAPDDSRFDMDGNGSVDVLDANAALGNRGSTGPTKPSGHTCSP